MKTRPLRSLLLLGTLLATTRASAQEPAPTLPDETEPPPPIAPREPPPPQPPPRQDRAPATPRYGAQGELQVTNGMSLSGFYTSYDGSQARFGGVTVAPALDWFIVRNLLIGIEADVSYSYAKGYGADSSIVETTHTTVGGGVRLGYVIPLGEHLSLAPRTTLGVQSIHSTQKLLEGTSSSVGNALGLPSTSSVGPWAFVYFPILFHPTPHFFLGIGPSVYHVFARTLSDPDAGGQQTSWSAHGTVGVWWGGHPTEEGTDVGRPLAEAKRARFGEAEQFVLDGSLGVSVYRTTYASSPSNGTSFSLTPGVDNFVLDHLSVGIAVSLGIAHYEALAPPTRSGAPTQTVKTDSFGFGIGPRLGVDIPLARSLSFYPRANISFGVDGFDATSGANENKISRTIVSVGLNAPLLVHVAEHAFCGLGPSVYHELTGKSDQAPDLTATTVGASFLVGGWL